MLTMTEGTQKKSVTVYVNTFLSNSIFWGGDSKHLWFFGGEARGRGKKLMVEVTHI